MLHGNNIKCTAAKDCMFFDWFVHVQYSLIWIEGDCIVGLFANSTTHCDIIFSQWLALLVMEVVQKWSSLAYCKTSVLVTVLEAVIDGVTCVLELNAEHPCSYASCRSGGHRRLCTLCRSARAPVCGIWCTVAAEVLLKHLQEL